MFENRDKTDINELGEFGLIRMIQKAFPMDEATTTVGIGDDGAVFPTLEGYQTVVSTDLLVENVHFDLMYTPLKHLGYKAVVNGISDICAMNAVPTHLLLSLSFSSKFTLEAIEELYDGVRLACAKYKIDLIGGDTASSVKGLTLSVTAIGKIKETAIVRRSGAKPGDLLCVTGDLGGAYMGLQLLEREKRVFLEHPDMQPDLKNHDYIVGRQLKPEARVDVVDWLGKEGIVPTSMMDVSDGISSELFHLSEASDVSFAVHEEKLPIDQDTFNMAVEFGIDATTAALQGGEDFELLFTVDQSAFESLKNHPDITVIGYVRERSMKNQLISKGGNIFDLVAQGWPAQS
ncbi:MAG: thiamine-phosphate kinase [Flavobacteriales bacterium]|nr:thiamine-phosphate kinase [Bacteroidota bacterium]MCB9240794.1 thiamine-phosphate kinase [Flavobacteriales bacterium]